MTSFRPPEPGPAARRPVGLLPALTALVLAVGFAAPARAERADRTKPLEFQAQAVRIDEKQRLRVLTGEVQISKGSLLIRAETIEVREIAGGYLVAAIGAPGAAATFRQKREGVDEQVEGQAERIEYDTRAEKVLLSGQAAMRRLRGTRVADEVTGHLIRYDNVAELYEIDGRRPAGPAPAAASAPAGRVKGTLEPREAASGGNP
jgi:lipopolysaccharide export system protein LptA